MQDGYVIPIGAVLFVLFWQLMSRLVLKPFISLANQREEMTTGAEHSATAQEEKAESLIQQVETRLNSVRGELARKKVLALEEAKKEATRVVEEAQKAAADVVVKARKDIAERGASLRQTMASKVEDLAAEATNRILQ